MLRCRACDDCTLLTIPLPLRGVTFTNHVLVNIVKTQMETLNVAFFSATTKFGYNCGTVIMITDISKVLSRYLKLLDFGSLSDFSGMVSLFCCAHCAIIFIMQYQ
jgi:hypothetical protein